MKAGAKRGAVRNACFYYKGAPPRLKPHPLISAAASSFDKETGPNFPHPPHLDYPFCMYRQNSVARKERRSVSGLMKGLKKLKLGLTNKKTCPTAGDKVGKTKIQPPTNQYNEQLPPSRPIEKKKSFLKRIFKSTDANSKKSSNFQRGKFSSSRSFSGSVSQLISRGNRARSQSVENLKNYFRRDGGRPLIKRSSSSVSLTAKLSRSLSVSSLVGRRNGFARQGSMVSIAGQFSRPSNSGFRRADSVRSLHGAYDIATRVLEPRSVQQQQQQQPENCFEDSYYDARHVPAYNAEIKVPFRGGWRPSSRISRREPYGYEYPQFYDERSVAAYSDFYDYEEPCQCCYDDDTYYDDVECYSDVYDNSIDPYYDQRNIYDSRVTLANFDNRYVNPHFTRAQSVRSIGNLPLRPHSQAAASYSSPVNIRRDNGMVVAPLNVKVTEERRAERRQLARSSRVFDTFV